MAKTFGLHLTEPLPPIDVLLSTDPPVLAWHMPPWPVSPVPVSCGSGPAEGGEPIEGVTGATGTCLHTPGHTRGSICYHFPEFKLVLTGDTLFKSVFCAA